MSVITGVGDDSSFFLPATGDAPSTMSPELHIHDSAGALFEAAARRIIELGNEAIEQRGEFNLALAGGQTPRALYRCLGAPALQPRLDWTRLQFWFGDERCVPPDHPDSNYRMARETLLEQLPLDSRQFHRMEGELEPELAARRYRDAMTQLPRDGDGLPIFDLILLGLGADGHIASLFPDTPASQLQEFTVAALHSPLHRHWRLSLTLPVINRARHLLLVVSGEKKADILRHIFNRPPGARPLPVQLLEPRGTLEWYIDRDAALLLPAGRGR
ncbi:MAG TPA: 6-phosphogluconolactonase [Gammaproteobacteria bacterium]